MASAMVIRSTKNSWAASTGIRDSASLKAVMRSAIDSSVMTNSSPGISSPRKSRTKTSRPSTGRSPRRAAASLNRSYSIRRRDSSWRMTSGSSSSSSSSWRGSSDFDLMWTRVEAITRNSPATSRFSACIASR